MGKNIPVTVGSILSPQDVQAWYVANPILPTKAEQSFPIVSSDKTTWKTISNATLSLNEAADHMSLNSPVPVSGRPGFKDVIGEMTSFGKGYEWSADEIEKFERLKANYAQLQNTAAATELLDFYGNDLKKIRTAMYAQMAYMSWAVISDACQYSFLSTNSIYMQGLTAMTYPVAAWQKDAVTTTWADEDTKILDDIQTVLDAGEDKGKNYLVITINKKWFGYVRKNTQIKNQTITLVGSLVGADNNPNLETINNMLESYFDGQVRFNVIDEKVSREDLDGVKTTSSPFKDGVAVFSQEVKLGRFEWNKIPIIDTTKEVYENFFLVGNYTKIDPSYAKFYGKGRAFPVIDTYSDNYYLKIDAVAWS